MKAHIEYLSGIVRVGPDTDEYGKSWDYSVTFSTDGKIATLKAFKADGKFTISHARAIIAALQAEGLQVRWERLNADGTLKREIIVTERDE